eukprot:scaffold84807_cov44-Attheya_sp.AAC.1
MVVFRSGSRNVGRGHPFVITGGPKPPMDQGFIASLLVMGHRSQVQLVHGLFGYLQGLFGLDQVVVVRLVIVGHHMGGEGRIRHHRGSKLPRYFGQGFLL